MMAPAADATSDITTVENIHKDVLAEICDNALRGHPWKRPFMQRLRGYSYFMRFVNASDVRPLLTRASGGLANTCGSAPQATPTEEQWQAVWKPHLAGCADCQQMMNEHGDLRKRIAGGIIHWCETGETSVMSDKEQRQAECDDDLSQYCAGCGVRYQGLRKSSKYHSDSCRKLAHMRRKRAEERAQRQ